MSYPSLYRIVIGVVIAAVLIFGFIALLGIWDLLTDDDVIWKSLLTALVTAFVGGVVVACLKFLEEREKRR